MKEYVVVVFVRVCVFSKVLEQLCAPSTSNEVSNRCENLEVEALESFEPSNDIGIQCCLCCQPKFVVTSNASAQTESQDVGSDTTKDDVAVCLQSFPDDELSMILHDHNYSTTNFPSPVKSIPIVSPQKSERSLLSEDEERPLESDINDTDDDYIPSSQETLSTKYSESEAEPEGNTLENHVKEPKYLVFQSCLRQLFKFCVDCGATVTEMSFVCHGSQLSVKTTCMKNHASTWSSQPFIKRAAVGNLLISSSVLFTGNTFTRLQNFASCLGLKFLSERVFYRHQDRYLFPVINDAWEKEGASVIEELSTRAIVNLSGDGRCDSPGHSAKYGTYTMMDNDTGKIATFNVVQVSEVNSSNAMEKEGFLRCLNTLEEKVTVSCITTDRHISIASTMEKEFSHIKHQYDVWHLSKSVVKKLNKKAKVKRYEELAPWIQSISNHLWWCAATCNGDVTLLREKWKSIMHHVTHKHSWQDSEVFHQCAHPRLSHREARRKCWLEPGSPAHVALEEVVLQPKLLKDLARATDFCHTGGLEVYHSMTLKYCPKREHFSFKGMVARTQLAALDNNHNTGRNQAVIQKGPRSGEARYRKCFPKMHKRWVVKPVLEKKSYTFLPELQLKVLQLCEGGMEVAHIAPIDEVDLPRNIASVPAPDKGELIQRHRSRFSR